MDPVNGMRLVVFALLLGIGTLRLDAETDYVALGQHKVHPTRLLARYTRQGQAAARTATQLQNKGWSVRHRFTLVPGLVVLEPAAKQAPIPGPVALAKPTAGDILQRIANLKATGLFDYVEPDYAIHALATPSDAGFTDGTLWGLRNTGLAGADIDAVPAWDLTTGSTNIIVAVIDTGIRYTHDELISQMWRNPAEIPGNGLDDDANGYVDDVFGFNAITSSGDPHDDNGHGTHVAGTIGGAANDGHPLVGVAWNVRLMACKFLGADGSGATSDAITAINYAVAKGARILNNSWAGGSFSFALLDAIANAQAKGVLFVAAAGNDASDNDTLPSYPASYELDNVIAVAAVDRWNQLASFSNYGRRSVHLAAPGVDIYSCGSTSDSDYRPLSGTSMAAPHVSGVAALILAQHPDIPLAEVRQRLLLGSVSTSSLDSKTLTGGRLNAHHSLTVQADDSLEVSISPAPGSPVPAGSPLAVYVTVTDLFGVSNATVTAAVSSGTNLLFTNDGAAPDANANDSIYSALLETPTNFSTLSLTVLVTAPGKTSSTNSVVYTLQQPPPNDAFANRTIIPPSLTTVTGTNVKATREPGEPEHGGTQGGASVWWSWTAPSTGILTVSTIGSDFDTLLSAYTGTELASLSSLASNDEPPSGDVFSIVSFPVEAGITYHLAVDGYRGENGHIVLNLSLGGQIVNDAFANRTSLTGTGFTIVTSNFGATKEGGEPFHASQAGGASVWWSWTPPVTGPVIISTKGSSFDTLLAVYTGVSVTNLRLVDANDDIQGNVLQASEVEFTAYAGETYQIAVDGHGGQVGSVSLNIVAPPSNDDFANRLVLSGTFVESTGYSLGASVEADEPYHGGDIGGKSVWWSWTAPANGNASITTAGSNFDTLLGVYTGNAVNALALVAGNDDVDPGIIRHSEVTFAATAGTEYQIAVDGFNETPVPESGLINLNLTLNGTSKLGSEVRLPGGAFQFKLTGEPNKVYVLETSTNLVDWESLGTFTLNGKSLIYLDNAATNLTQRFYRSFAAPLTNLK